MGNEIGVAIAGDAIKVTGGKSTAVRMVLKLQHRDAGAAEWVMSDR
jgi:hypothetical protein